MATRSLYLGQSFGPTNGVRKHTAGKTNRIISWLSHLSAHDRQTKKIWKDIILGTQNSDLTLTSLESWFTDVYCIYGQSSLNGRTFQVGEIYDNLPRQSCGFGLIHIIPHIWEHNQGFVGFTGSIWKYHGKSKWPWLNTYQITIFGGTPAMTLGTHGTRVLTHSHGNYLRPTPLRPYKNKQTVCAYRYRMISNSMRCKDAHNLWLVVLLCINTFGIVIFQTYPYLPISHHLMHIICRSHATRWMPDPGRWDPRRANARRRTGGGAVKTLAAADRKDRQGSWRRNGETALGVFLTWGDNMSIQVIAYGQILSFGLPIFGTPHWSGDFCEYRYGTSSLSWRTKHKEVQKRGP